MYAYMHAYIHTYACICVCVCVYTYMHVCMCISCSPCSFSFFPPFDFFSKKKENGEDAVDAEREYVLKMRHEEVKLNPQRKP